MASSLIIYRRSLRAISALHHSFSSTLTLPISAHISSSSSSSSSSSCPRQESSPSAVGVQTRSFRSTSISLLSSRYTEIPDEIGPDTILFEGCDYNHWLFVMDFPKDNKPSPEEMIRTYEETCAKGLNISVEEAKKKIYACSTTTYTGFQAVVTEEESKKFESLPGVIFVLPDSYIDPVNKQYGGDQYIDGTIIPRPPPIQYGRNQGGRRDFNRQGQGNPSYNNQGGRNFGPSQNYPPQQGSQGYSPQQNYSPPSQGYPPQQNYSPPRNIDQAPQNYSQQQTFGSAPPQQSFGSPGQEERRNYAPQPNFGPPGQGERRNYAPRENFGPPGQGERGNFAPQQNFRPPGQGERGNFAPQQNFGPPGRGERGNFAPQQNFGPPGQGERGNFAPQQNFGPPGQGERRDSVPSEGGWDFKPSYMEEFEQTDKGNHHSKEQTGSQQRFPPPGPGNFTGEGRY